MQLKNLILHAHVAKKRENNTETPTNLDCHCGHTLRKNQEIDFWPWGNSNPNSKLSLGSRVFQTDISWKDLFQYSWTNRLISYLTQHGMHRSNRKLAAPIKISNVEMGVCWDQKTYLKRTASLLTKKPMNQPCWGISKDILCILCKPSNLFLPCVYVLDVVIP